MKKNNYEHMLKYLQAILEDESNPIANLANASAIINESVDNLNWAGFYLYNGKELVLGPFQGKSACVRIALGKGVCGNAAKEEKTYIIENVHEFPGHIACDAASNSEIVVPIVKDDNLIGVLDLDSNKYSNFDEIDKKYLEKAVEIIVKNTEF